jgi:hypothetical protein
LIDYFAIGLTHGLLTLAIWRLLQRADLDDDGNGGAKPVKPWLKGRKAAREQASGQADADA